jgi:hypothetical protein
LRTSASIEGSISAWVTRRAKFICDEAQFKDGRYDLSVIHTLRVLSNMATVGSGGDSMSVKRKNKRVSAAALIELEKLLRSNSNQKNAFKIWHDVTTNEHPEPLKQVWCWLREEGRSPQELMDRLNKNKFITVLKTEDSAINERGFRSKGAPEERHKGLDPVDMPDRIFDMITIKSRKKLAL